MSDAKLSALLESSGTSSWLRKMKSLSSSSKSRKSLPNTPTDSTITNPATGSSSTDMARLKLNFGHEQSTNTLTYHHVTPCNCKVSDTVGDTSRLQLWDNKTLVSFSPWISLPIRQMKRRHMFLFHIRGLPLVYHALIINAIDWESRSTQEVNFGAHLLWISMANHQTGIDTSPFSWVTVPHAPVTPCAAQSCHTRAITPGLHLATKIISTINNNNIITTSTKRCHRRNYRIWSKSQKAFTAPTRPASRPIHPSTVNIHGESHLAVGSVQMARGGAYV